MILCTCGNELLHLRSADYIALVDLFNSNISFIYLDYIFGFNKYPGFKSAGSLLSVINLNMKSGSSVIFFILRCACSVKQLLRAGKIIYPFVFRTPANSIGNSIISVRWYFQHRKRWCSRENYFGRRATLPQQKEEE